MGICRRRAPTIVTSRDGAPISRWPETYAQSFCGEHAPVEKRPCCYLHPERDAGGLHLFGHPVCADCYCDSLDDMAKFRDKVNARRGAEYDALRAKSAPVEVAPKEPARPESADAHAPRVVELDGVAFLATASKYGCNPLGTAIHDGDSFRALNKAGRLVEYVYRKDPRYV